MAFQTFRQPFQTFLTQRRDEISKGSRLFYSYVLIGIVVGVLLMIPNALFVFSNIFNDYGNTPKTILSFFLLFNLFIIPVLGLIYMLYHALMGKEEIIEYLSKDWPHAANTFYSKIIPLQLKQNHTVKLVHPKTILNNSKILSEPYIISYKNNLIHVNRIDKPKREILDIKLSVELNKKINLCIATCVKNNSTKDIIAVQTQAPNHRLDSSSLHREYNKNIYTYLCETDSMTKHTTSVKQYLKKIAIIINAL